MAAVGLWLIPFTRVSLVLACLGVTLVGIWAGGRAERLVGKKDPGIIVIDEVAGMMVSVLFLPLTVPVLISAFFLFRLFDIWKPFPAHGSQSIPGGVGVMLDDLIAGAYALLILLGTRVVFGLPA